MATLNREVRAVQNPGLGSILIWRSVSRYQQTHEIRAFMPLPLAFLVLPMLFHEETASVVASTKTSSGLRKLTEKFRSAQESKTDLLLSVASRAAEMRTLSWDAICLGVSSNLMALNTREGNLMSLTETPLVAGVPFQVRPLLANAEKLGAWFAGLSLYEISLQVQVRF